MPDIEKLIKQRRTVDSFKPGAPPRKLVLRAIDAARWAPNHHLTQPWHFYFPDQDMIGRIIDLNARIVTAKKGAQAGDNKRKRWATMPGWLISSCERSGDELRDQENYAACCCAIYAMSLVLWQYDIGAKWTTGDVIRDPRIYDICWIDRRSQVITGIIWYGYPESIPAPQPRLGVESIVTEY